MFAQVQGLQQMSQALFTVGFNNKIIQVAATQHHFQSVILFSSYFNRAVKKDGPVCAKAKNSCCYLDFLIYISVADL